MKLKIVLCDDEKSLTNHYASVINNYFSNKDNYQLLTMNSADDVLEYIHSQKLQGGLFFLDIDLQDEKIDGIKLAKQIREIDASAEIAFISTHEEMLVETIQQRINTLNFIFKDDGLEAVERQIKQTIDSAIKYLKPLDDDIKYFEYVEAYVRKKIAESKINFLETSDKKGKIIIHTDDGVIYLNGIIKEIEYQLPNFYRSHKSFLVNLHNVEQFDRQERQLYFKNGDKCEVAFRKLHEVRLKLKE